MSMLVKEGLNWIITDYIEDISMQREMVKDLTEENWAPYTSAKGPKSRQHYIINPAWMPSEVHKEPAKWPEAKTWYEQTVKGVLSYHGILPIKWHNLNASRAWSVVGEEGSYHTIHDHGPSRICTITYLEVPEVSETPYQGQVYFVLQCDPYSPVSHVKHKVVHITPRPGLMVIFPSWILHGVYPQGPGIRQTLNIDFDPVLNDGPEESAGYLSLV